MNISRSLLLAVALATATACGGAKGGTTAPRVDRNMILREEFLTLNASNLFDVVQRFRPQWLRPRGTDSINNPTSVQVYLDNQRLGGVESLRQISPVTVQTVRHFDGIEASGRWGLDHGSGVIFITSLGR
jgi:hypothetical protein